MNDLRYRRFRQLVEEERCAEVTPSASLRSTDPNGVPRFLQGSSLAICLGHPDEPTSALDLHHQEVALALASRLCQEIAHGVLVILHDLNLAAAWADRILLLKQGRIVHRGKPDEVMTEPILREVYEVDTLVLPHPKTGRPIVTIDRKRPSTNPHP